MDVSYKEYILLRVYLLARFLNLRLNSHNKIINLLSSICIHQRIFEARFVNLSFLNLGNIPEYYSNMVRCNFDQILAINCDVYVVH